MCISEWCLLSSVYKMCISEWCLLSSVYKMGISEWCLLSSVYKMCISEWCLLSSVNKMCISRSTIFMMYKNCIIVAKITPKKYRYDNKPVIFVNGIPLSYYYIPRYVVTSAGITVVVTYNFVIEARIAYFSSAKRNAGDDTFIRLDKFRVTSLIRSWLIICCYDISEIKLCLQYIPHPTQYTRYVPTFF